MGVPEGSRRIDLIPGSAFHGGKGRRGFPGGSLRRGEQKKRNLTGGIKSEKKKGNGAQTGALIGGKEFGYHSTERKVKTGSTCGLAEDGLSSGGTVKELVIFAAEGTDLAVGEHKNAEGGTRKGEGGFPWRENGTGSDILRLKCGKRLSGGK